MGTNRYSCEEIQKRVNDKRGEGVLTLDATTYVNIRTKCRFIDNEFGEWWVRPDNILSGQEHPRRKRWKIKSLETLQQQIYDRFGDQIVLDASTYVSASAPARFVDKDYGEFWIAPVHIFFRKYGGNKHRGFMMRGKNHVVDVEIIAKRIEKLHPNVYFDKSTYVMASVPARFVDKDYGEWWATPSYLLYGHGHQLRGSSNRQLSLKIAKRNSKRIVQHWKTKENCVANYGYEYATLLWLNHHKYDYDWQISFYTPFECKSVKRKSIYTIDLYIKDGPYTDTWVEIKGSWKFHQMKNQENDSRRKWEWFHELHSNSQLWTYDQLRQMNIIDKRGKPIIKDCVDTMLEITQDGRDSKVVFE